MTYLMRLKHIKTVVFPHRITNIILIQFFLSSKKTGLFEVFVIFVQKTVIVMVQLKFYGVKFVGKVQLYLITFTNKFVTGLSI